MAGLTDQGLLIETFQSLLAALHAGLRLVFGNALPLDDSTIEGQSWKILVRQLVKVWQQLETMYSSWDPNKATGAALDALCVLTGTFRQPPSFSAGKVFVTGTASTVPSGSQFQIDDDGVVGAIIFDADMVAADAWDTGASYVVGDVVENAGNIYYCRTAVDNTISAPTFTERYPDDAAFIAGQPAIYWVWVGEGTAYVEVDASAIDTGPVEFPSFTINRIFTPVVGWQGVGNALDFEVGTDVESDESLREARRANLSAPGTGTLDAIRAALLDIDGVIAATVFVNPLDVVDADGIPAHSIEALVRGGEDQDIYDCLLANVAAGVYTHGNTAGTATDSEGTAHAMRFTRPEEIEIYVAITLEYDALLYPEDGDDQVAAAIVEFGDAQATGKDAVAWSIGSCAREVDGTLKVTVCDIDIAPAPATSADIVITKRQLAVFDTSRIDITSTPATP